MSANSEIDPDNFCYYPFMQMLLQPTGVVSPCCWNQGSVLGKVPEQNLDEIWNGETIRSLRREFLEGKPKQCEMQMRHIQCHKWSRRNDMSKVQLTEIQSKGPLRLDVRLNGKCNLQCVMCDVWKQPNGVYDQSNFWTNGPTEVFPHLIEMDVLGGEPFVQGDTYRLIDEISKVNSECTWAFVTNGHYKFSETIKSKLDKIKIRWMQLSLDSIQPDTYRKVRVKGELKRTLETLFSLKEYQRRRIDEGRGFDFLISMCVQKENCDEVEEFLEFSKVHHLNCVLQFAYDPRSTSVLDFDQPRKLELIKKLESLTRFDRTRIDAVLLPLKESYEQNNR